MAGPIFSNIRYPHLTFPGGIHDFYGRLYAGVGLPYGGFPNLGNLDLFGSPGPYQLSGPEGGSCCPMPLGFSAPGPPGFDRYGQHYSSFLYQQTRKDPFPNLVASISGSLYVAAGSGHSSQSQTHTRMFKRDNRLPFQTKSANIDRVESSFRDCQLDFPVLGNSNGGHVCHSPQCLPTSVHVSNSGASSTGGGCSVSGLAGEISVHVYAISSAQQSHSETKCHPGSRSDTDSSLVAITAVVSTPTSTLCRQPSVLPIPPRSTVSTGTEIQLGWKVVPWRLSCNITAGFSDEVSRLAAAPSLPSNNRMFDDRWLRFTHWAAREGFDPLSPTAAQIATNLLGSVLDRTGKAKVVQHRTISDMI